MARRPKRAKIRGRGFDDLAALMGSFAANMDEAIEQIHRSAGWMAARNWARVVPVDEGTARSSIQVGNGSPPAPRTQAYASYPSRYKPPYGPGGQFTETANVSAVTAAARAVVQRHRPNTPIIIASELPYMGRLDGGYSPQSPAGFIARSVLETVNQLPAVVAPELKKAFR